MMPQEESSHVIVNIPLQEPSTLSNGTSVVMNNSSSSGSSDIKKKIQNFQSFQIVGTEKMSGSEGDGFSIFSNQHSVYYLVKVTYLLENEDVSYTLRRRYTHFKELFDRMTGLKQGQPIVYNNETLSFPEKEKWDSFLNWKTDDIVKQRSTVFGKLLMEIYDHRDYYLLDEEIFSFFSPSKYADE